MASPSQSACWRPFKSTSPFNTALPSSPKLAPNSALEVKHMLAYGWSFGGSTRGYGVPRDGTHPVYFATDSDPEMTITCKHDFGADSCTGANRVNIGGRRIHVPAGARPEDDSDAHMTVIETATGAEYDLWDTTVSGSTLAAGSGAEVNVSTGNGTGGGGNAAGFALSAGLLRPSELAAGRIDHALVVSIPCTDAVGANVGFAWPATGGWGSTCPSSASSAPKLGQLIVLQMSKSQIAHSHAPAWEKTIMSALAHYGAYVEDVNGGPSNTGIYVLTQGAESWTSVGRPNKWAAVARKFHESGSTLTSSVPIPTKRLEIVAACVTKGTCDR
jgi:hypothetical protein